MNDATLAFDEHLMRFLQIRLATWDTKHVAIPDEWRHHAYRTRRTVLCKLFDSL